ncbi:HamA C-terminal domain-containing protein [Planctomicrobium sp. SH668]|uniref:HamA C-terminal domain-containing protein n=1 Tax=Planctomicrobium sp. SH668 TaxID=3448126 RepID=UPI003F5C2028
MTSGTVPIPNLLPPLQDYLEVCEKRFTKCLAPLDEKITIDGSNIDVTLHFVRFDQTTKEPRFNLLAKALAKHVVSFCLSARRRALVKSRSDYDEDEGELFMIARDYFRKLKDSGEVGELLLFFLLEAALGAPQVVCKMELKTNPKDEIKGADGIHVKWDHKDEHLDVFLGEAKLYQDIGSAMTNAMESVKDIYELNRLDEELNLVTAHFKHLDADFQRRVTAWVNRETAIDECHIIHSCLIGWDWSQYKRLATDRNGLFDDFEREYRGYCKNIRDLLNSRFQAYSHRHLSFHFLFIPFVSVGDFRKAFYRELLGIDIGQ